MTWEDIMGRDNDSLGAGVVTAGEAKQLIARIDKDIQRLDDTIQAANVGKQFRRGWTEFRGRWRTFYYEEKDYPSRLSARSALMFVNEAKQWRQALGPEKAARAGRAGGVGAADGGEVTGPALNAPVAPSASFGWWVVGGLIVTGVVVGAKALR